MKKLLVCMLCIVVALAGCTNKEDAAKTNGEELEEVSIVLDWYPNAIHSFIYAAEEKGYFKEEGIKVNIQFPANPTDPLTLPAAGQATLGIYYQPDLISAIANENVPIKAVGTLVHKPLNRIISLKESNITSPKDLEGKKVGFSGTPLSEAYIKQMVKNDGGDPSKVEIIDVGFELLSSITAKKVDATTGGLINHEVPVMRHQGLNPNYFNPADYGIPDYYEMVFVAGNKTIKEDKAKLQKFFRAAQKGMDYMKSNPEDALQILLDNQQKDSFPLTKEVEKESMDILLPLMDSEEEAFLSQTKEVWDMKANWLKDNGLIKEVPNAEDVFVNIME
ncbi:ABC transporter substrate-binding protein [Priestia taiwanensis]|uniref:ABC transporter substrate-binding protein n=1 Tax=Priestia taiwanensis TaxID=1347902 RepID=A0A917AQ78_9BACI|nr:putative hydroxymethylpyrimidine transport system substrate-binding protein [Priestia taiwanensis]GGE67602.1 ABC transporter substrate-binding protein [Priestia taiwanensis]